MGEKYGSEETYKSIVTALLESDNKYILVINNKQFINRIANDEKITPEEARELIILYCKIIEMIRQKKSVDKILKSYSDFYGRVDGLIRVVRAHRRSGE